MRKFRDAFRTVSGRDWAAALKLIGQMRATLPPAAYPDLIASFRSAAPRHALLPVRRVSRFQDLLWWSPVPPVPIPNELVWAPIWLRPAVRVLNTHLVNQDALQDLLCVGDFAEMRRLLDARNSQCGWSVAAAELLFGTAAHLGGRDAVRVLEKQLRENADNRVSGLVASILADRNDPALSFDGFQAKCLSSFPRFTLEWLKAYLPYCVLGDVEDPDARFPIILSVEFMSSVLDYYEGIVSLIDQTRHDPALTRHREAGVQAASNLMSIGILDQRLARLAMPVGGGEICGVSDHSISPAGSVARRMLGLVTAAPERASGFEGRLHELITRLECEGADAPEALTQMISISMAFKALPIGLALHGKAVQSALAPEGTILLPPYADMIGFARRIEYVLIGSKQEVENSLRALAGEGDEISRLASEVCSILDGGGAGEIDVDSSPLVAFWLALNLIDRRRNVDARILIEKIASSKLFGSRHVARLRILSDVVEGDLLGAIRTAASTIAQHSRLSAELPLGGIFRGRKWSELRDLDPVLLGFVAHYANVTSPDSGTRFICRMACRAFYEAMFHESLEERWARTAGSDDRSILVAFLRDVWSDENLALVDSLKSMQDLRLERIRIFQDLLVWDSGNASEYSAAIRDLTFDETISRGLSQIDQTRFFVNESAISRWAEKELISDFERWALMVTEVSSSAVTDELLRKYLIDPNVDLLLEGLPREEATQANTLLLSLLDRLLKRFLLDPLHGLNSYLSLRIRHGSLRGALLGPLEQGGFLISGDYSEERFREAWAGSFRGSPEGLNEIVVATKSFSGHVQEYVKGLIDQRIQVSGGDHPRGLIPGSFDAGRVRIVFPLFSAPITFNGFLSKSYTLFWLMLGPARAELDRLFREEAKNFLHQKIEDLIQKISAVDIRAYPMQDQLRAVATATQAQCDTVATWFLPQAGLTQQTYQISAAIRIARQATQNIYRTFPDEIEVVGELDDGLLLSTAALGTLFDCLFVIFENAWRHSGLGVAMGSVRLHLEYERKVELLTVRAENRLSDDRRRELVDGKVALLRTKYLSAMPIDLIPKEGGSGFAKLARIVSPVDRDRCPEPLKFGVSEDGLWFVSVAIPVISREGAIDVYL